LLISCFVRYIYWEVSLCLVCADKFLYLFSFFPPLYLPVCYAWSWRLWWKSICLPKKKTSQSLFKSQYESPSPIANRTSLSSTSEKGNPFSGRLYFHVVWVQLQISQNSTDIVVTLPSLVLLVIQLKDSRVVFLYIIYIKHLVSQVFRYV